jgi:hypothetical protein
METTPNMENVEEGEFSVRDELSYKKNRKKTEYDEIHTDRSKRAGNHVQLNDLHPTFEFILTTKKNTAVVLIFSGVIGLIVSFFFDTATTIISRQVPADGDNVGELTSTPISKQAGQISPIRTISVFAFLSGLVTFVIATKYFTEYRAQIQDHYVARIAYYTAVTQSTVIFMTILPLTSVINVYELTFAVMLTFAEYMMYIYSDIINVQPSNNWDIYDASNEMEKTAERSAAQVVSKHKQGLFIIMEYNYEPLICGIIIHCVLYVVIFYHLAETLGAKTYDIAPIYTASVIITSFLQMLIPMLKLCSMIRPTFMKKLYNYKTYVFLVELIECVNIELLIFFLILGLF